MGGYYETNKIADVLGLPVTVAAINVMVNGIHWHNHLEILLCKRGEMHIRAEGKEYTLGEGDFITINSGDSHEIYGGEPGNLQIICSVENKLLGDMQDKRIQCATVGEGGVREKDAVLVRQALSEMAYLSILDAGTEEQTGIVRKTKAEPEYQDWICRMHPLKQDENWNCYHMYMYQLLMVLVRCKADGRKGEA